MQHSLQFVERKRQEEPSKQTSPEEVPPTGSKSKLNEAALETLERGWTVRQRKSLLLGIKGNTTLKWINYMLIGKID